MTAEEAQEIFAWMNDPARLLPSKLMPVSKLSASDRSARKAAGLSYK